MGEIARSKSRIASDLKTRDSNRWRLCDLKLRFETRDWRFVLNTPIQQNCEKGCDLSPRSKIASDWRLVILPISAEYLVDVSNIFNFSSARGMGIGKTEAPGGAGGLAFIENPRRGGAGRVSARIFVLGGQQDTKEYLSQRGT